MTTLVVAMLICIGVAAIVVAAVAVPARRQGRHLLTSRGEDVIARALSARSVADRPWAPAPTREPLLGQIPQRAGGPEEDAPADRDAAVSGSDPAAAMNDQPGARDAHPDSLIDQGASERVGPADGAGGPTDRHDTSREEIRASGRPETAGQTT